MAENQLQWNVGFCMIPLFRGERRLWTLTSPQRRVYMATAAPPPPAVGTALTRPALANRFTRQRTRRRRRFFFALMKRRFRWNESEEETRPAAVDAGLLLRDGGHRAH